MTHRPSSLALSSLSLSLTLIWAMAAADAAAQSSTKELAAPKEPAGSGYEARMTEPAVEGSRRSSLEIVTPRGLNLMAIYRRAYDFEPEFQVAKADQQVAQSDVLAAQLAYLPSFNASYGQSPIENRVRTTYQVSQPILDLQKFATVLTASPLSVVAQANFVLAEQALANRVIQVVMEIIKAQETLRNNDEQIKTLEQQLDRATRRYQLRQGTITEVSSTQVRLDQAKATREQLLVQSAAFEQQYQAMTGLEPDLSQMRFAPDPSAPKAPAASEVLVQAQDNSPKIIAANAQVRLAELEKRKVQAGYLPQVNYLVQSTKLEGSNTSNYNGFNLSIPLGVSASNFAAQRKAIFAVDRAMEQFKSVNSQVGLDAQKLTAQVKAGGREIVIRKRVVASAEKAVQANLKAFDAGIVGSSDMLNSILTLFEARRDHVTALAQLAQAQLQLQMLRGVANESSMLELSDLMLHRHR